jgi:hypothetical protein
MDSENQKIKKKRITMSLNAELLTHGDGQFELTDAQGYRYIATVIDNRVIEMEQIISLDDALDPNILSAPDPGQGDVPVVFVYKAVFFANAMLWLLCLCAAFVGFTYFPWTPTAWIALLVVGLCAGATYILLVCMRKLRRVVLALLVMLWMCLIVWTGALTIVVQGQAPIQFCLIMFASFSALTTYVMVSRRNISTKWVIVTLIITTIVAWCAGLYAYIEDNDWVAAGLVFTASVVANVYHVLWISAHKKSYNVDERVTAFIEFYTWKR